MKLLAVDFEQWLARGGEAMVASGDVAFGWLLALPRDVALVGLALATVLASVVARRCCADQDRLRRSVADLRVLKTLKRAARQAGAPRSELLRFDHTTAQVRLWQMRVDLRVLGVVIVPLAWIATWAATRLDYEPIELGKDYTLTARLPISSAGRVAHLVPEPWFTPETSLIARAAPDPDHPGWARADWRLRFVDRDESRAESRGMPLALTMRHAGETATHPVFLDGRRPSPAVAFAAETDDSRAASPASESSPSESVARRLVESRLSVAEYRFLGWVPGWPAAGLAPWVVAYLLLSLLLLPIAKRVTRTC
jgi:hypothetical protein